VSVKIEVDDPPGAVPKVRVVGVHAGGLGAGVLREIRRTKKPLAAAPVHRVYYVSRVQTSLAGASVPSGCVYINAAGALHPQVDQRFIGRVALGETQADPIETGSSWDNESPIVAPNYAVSDDDEKTAAWRLVQLAAVSTKDIEE
jgi:hypothetical protein